MSLRRHQPSAALHSSNKRRSRTGSAVLVQRQAVNCRRATPTLKPHIRHTPAVARQILERTEPIEAIQGDRANGLRLREAQIDRYAAAAILTGPERAPIGDAAAARTKMKAEVLASGIDRSRTRDSDALIFVVIRPECSIAPTDGAVASGG
jgi:hypothetical protein